MAKIIAEEDLGIVPAAERTQREIDVPLREKRRNSNLTLDDLTERSGVSKSTIVSTEGLRTFPRQGIADKIAKALNCEPTELFPEWQEFFIRGKKPSERKNEVPIDDVVKEEVTLLSKSLPDLEGCIKQRDLEDCVMVVLNTLKNREMLVLILRFGLQDGEELTLKATGKELGVTGERVRQIENKGLRKLRHPTRMQYLRDYCVKDNVGMGQETEALQNGLINAIYAGDEERVDRIAEKLRETEEGRTFLSAQLRDRKKDVVIESSPAPVPVLSVPELPNQEPEELIWIF